MQLFKRMPHPHVLYSSYIQSTQQIFIQRNQFYAFGYNNRVNLSIIKFKGYNYY